VLFAGIKRDTLNKYLSVFNQMNLKVSAVEYDVFSIHAADHLAGTKTGQVTAVVSADPREEEAHFSV